MRFTYAAMFVVLLSACRDTGTQRNEDYCGYNEGDRSCEELDPAKAFCVTLSSSCFAASDLPESDRYGCAAQMPTMECHSSCGEDNAEECGVAEGTASVTGPTGPSTSTTEDPTMGPGPDTESGDPTTDEPSTTTGPMGCDGNEDCSEGDARFCVSDVCVSCDATPDGDNACGLLDGGAAPLCFEGVCVQCREDNIGACTGTTPVCDAQNNTCTGCRFHEQCQALDMPACHIAEGSCISEMTEVNASADGMIQPEIAMIDPGMPHAIVLTGGGGNDEITIDGGQIIAIVSDANTTRDVHGIDTSPVLTVTGAGTIAYLHRIRLEDGEGVGISAASSGTLYADSVQIVQNSGGGITLGSGTMASLRNCMVGSTNNTNAVAATNATLDVLYSTLVGNFGTSVALSCDAGSEVTVRNSIAVGRSGDLSCAGATVTDSATLDDVGPYDEMWFDLDGGDLSLGSSTADFQDVAIWTLGDPPFDFEGDSRPNSDGDPDYAGADIP
jgi:hypothetical protein